MAFRGIWSCSELTEKRGEIIRIYVGNSSRFADAQSADLIGWEVSRQMSSLENRPNDVISSSDYSPKVLNTIINVEDWKGKSGHRQETPPQALPAVLQLCTMYCTKVIVGLIPGSALTSENHISEIFCPPLRRMPMLVARPLYNSSTPRLLSLQIVVILIPLPFQLKRDIMVCEARVSAVYSFNTSIWR